MKPVKGKTIIHSISSDAMDAISKARAEKGPATDVKWNPSTHRMELVYSETETAPITKTEAAC